MPLHWHLHLQSDTVNFEHDEPPSLHPRASMSRQVRTFALALHAFALHLLQQGRVLPEIVLHRGLAVPGATRRDGGRPVPLLGLVIPLCH